MRKLSDNTTVRLTDSIIRQLRDPLLKHKPAKTRYLAAVCTSPAEDCPVEGGSRRCPFICGCFAVEPYDWWLLLKKDPSILDLINKL